MRPLGVSVAAGIAAFYTVLAIRYVVQAVVSVRWNERSERGARGMCRSCGYDLTGNASGICPECGTRIDQRMAGKPPGAHSLISETQPWWVWASVVTAMTLAVLYFEAFV